MDWYKIIDYCYITVKSTIVDKMMKVRAVTYMYKTPWPQYLSGVCRGSRTVYLTLVWRDRMGGEESG